MADVTISSLPLGTPSTGGIIPFSLGGQTYSTALAQLSSLPFIPKAWAYFVGRGSNGDCTIYSQYNVARVTRLSSGNYSVTFTTPLSVIGCTLQGNAFGVNSVSYNSSFMGADSTSTPGIPKIVTELFFNVPILNGPNTGLYDPTGGAAFTVYGN